MSVTTVTHLHAAPDQGHALAGLLAEGGDRMRIAEGCESFEVLRDEDDPLGFIFLQRWRSHEAHDAAFAELILSTGHLAKVLEAIDQPIVRHAYQLQS